jgi:hypothetical protein
LVGKSGQNLVRKNLVKKFGQNLVEKNLVGKNLVKIWSKSG